MIRLASQNRRRAVQLLRQEHEAELVRQRHARQSQRVMRGALYLRWKAVCFADEEYEAWHAGILRCADPGSELLRCEFTPPLVERDGAPTVRYLREQSVGLCLPPLDGQAISQQRLIILEPLTQRRFTQSRGREDKGAHARGYATP